MKELFTALAKAQAEMEVAGLSKTNPFFKSRYADLNEVVRASRPYLTKHGLSVIQPLILDQDGTQLLRTMLCHSSGDSISSDVKINPPKSDVQSLGSYITYMRRYAYSALVGVCTGDEDDDGEAAVKSERVALPIKDIQPARRPDYISADQLADLLRELEGHAQKEQEILQKLDIEELGDIPRDRYTAIIKHIREYKLKLRDNSNRQENIVHL